MRYGKESQGLNGNSRWNLFYQVSIDWIKNIVDFKNKRNGDIDVYYNEVERRRFNMLRELRKELETIKNDEWSSKNQEESKSVFDILK